LFDSVNDNLAPALSQAPGYLHIVLIVHVTDTGFIFHNFTGFVYHDGICRIANIG
jgi:hypothetical protein